MYDEIPVSVLRAQIRKLLDELQQGRPRVMIMRNRVGVAALVSSEDLKALERADVSRMEYHEQVQQAQLREIRWLKEGLDGERLEATRPAD